MLPHIHEQMTRAAQSCLNSASNNEPRDCLAYYEGFTGLTTDTGQLALAVSRRNEDLGIATRWPDDPTMQIHWRSALRFYLDLKEKCPGRVAASRNLSVVGIACSGHYGDLQFLHAQASRGEDFATTRRKILDWASFTFDVAAGNVGSGAEYCTTLRQRDSSISLALAPDDFGFCDQRRGRFGASYLGWRVSTLFTTRCRNAFTALFGCREEQDEALAARLTQLRATGALLHLIQDSYSQSHVRRGVRGRIGAPETHVSKIVCRPATEFYDYNDQMAAHEDHDAADQPPSLDGASCTSGSEIHDPITASAMALWFVRRGGNSARLVEFMDRHVLGSAGP